jgi:enterochelin esterase-like enzyme
MIFFCAAMAPSLAQLPAVSYGSIRRIEHFQSAFVTARNVDIWLPAGYSPKKKYAVLYMHDGQMLFDSATTWNKQAWEVDDIIGRLLQEKKIKDVIVVGIWNGGKTRHTDYFPQKPYEGLTQAQKDTVTAQLQRAGRTKEMFTPASDNYLKFLVTELKPFIDKTYATRSSSKNTFIAGSSMGGLISMYAICEYPGVFGGAACLSTHWPGTFSAENNPVPGAFINYLKAHLPNPKNHRLYFDYGDQTLDAMYPPLQKKADEVIKGKSFTEKNWVTKYFPGDDHSEKAWSKRLDLPVLFLLKK